MQKFRKKPVVIEAEQFWPNNEPWPDGVCRNVVSSTGFAIHTLEGSHEVTPGDFIITGIKGEKYACKPDIFAATYDPIEVCCEPDIPVLPDLSRLRGAP